MKENRIGTFQYRAGANRALDAAQVIDELIHIAKEMRLSESRGQEMGLSDDEVAFYDALVENASAKQVIGDGKLRFLAQELVDRVKQSVTIDWQVRLSPGHARAGDRTGSRTDRGAVRGLEHR